jgi:hypothetical protein
MRKGFPLLLIIVLLSSCLKQEDFPNRPDVEFIGFFPSSIATNSADSLGFVRFSFTDGDGDLGLGDGDTLGVFAQGQPYYYNLFIHYFEKQNGEYIEVVPPLPFHVRFKRLVAVGGNGSLQGQMDVGVFGRPGTPYDTIRYEMYIVDRALQHSDTLVTNDIVLNF